MHQQVVKLAGGVCATKGLTHLVLVIYAGQSKHKDHQDDKSLYCTAEQYSVEQCNEGQFLQ